MEGRVPLAQDGKPILYPRYRSVEELLQVCSRTELLLVFLQCPVAAQYATPRALATPLYTLCAAREAVGSKWVGAVRRCRGRASREEAEARSGGLPCLCPRPGCSPRGRERGRRSGRASGRKGNNPGARWPSAN